VWEKRQNIECCPVADRGVYVKVSEKDKITLAAMTSGITMSCNEGARWLPIL